jgi:hypothetical protein
MAVIQRAKTILFLDTIQCYHGKDFFSRIDPCVAPVGMGRWAVSAISPLRGSPWGVLERAQGGG